MFIEPNIMFLFQYIITKIINDIFHLLVLISEIQQVFYLTAHPVQTNQKLSAQ